MRNIRSKNENGFSLVEMSVVVVIIALIISGVLAGNTLIKQAQINSVIRDYDKYGSAVRLFKEKYKALPGDFKAATSYWPTATNGNGSGLIGGTALNSAESLGIWQHLAFAGLIEGNYTGTYGSGVIPGGNAPNNNYNKQTTYWASANSLWSQYRSGNSMVLSGYSTTNGYDDPKVNVLDAYNMDSKIDDGMPYLGNIIGWNASDGVCVPAGLTLAASPNKQTTTYQISVKTDVCTMHFALDNYVFK